jgi:hypothetical protein
VNKITTFGFFSISAAGLTHLAIAKKLASTSAASRGERSMFRCLNMEDKKVASSPKNVVRQTYNLGIQRRQT